MDCACVALPQAKDHAYTSKLIEWEFSDPLQYNYFVFIAT